MAGQIQGVSDASADIVREAQERLKSALEEAAEHDSYTEELQLHLEEVKRELADRLAAQRRRKIPTLRELTIQVAIERGMTTGQVTKLVTGAPTFDACRDSAVLKAAQRELVRNIDRTVEEVHAIEQCMRRVAEGHPPPLLIEAQSRQAALNEEELSPLTLLAAQREKLLKKIPAIRLRKLRLCLRRYA